MALTDRSALSIKELSNRWGCHPDTVTNMLRDRQLKGFRVRERHLIPIVEVERIEGIGGQPKEVSDD